MHRWSRTALPLTLLLTACGTGTEPEGPAPAAEAPESAPAAMQEDAAPAAPDDVEALLLAAATGDHRSEANIARNEARHPVETLTFLGLTPESTVVEVWPGAGGWYTEVLAPVLRESGQLVVADYSTESESEYRAGSAQRFADKLASAPGVYDAVEVVAFEPPALASLGEADSADLVFIPRNYHNFIAGEIQDDVLAAAFEVLRPGGVLGIVQHREPEDAPPETEVRDGYVKESVVIADAEAVGFVLDARSEVNANPADTADHEAGVWTLPPTLTTCREIEDPEEKAACAEPYLAIGESDRMTLKFVKPEA
jgi:predicted methyltransferase